VLLNWCDDDDQRLSTSNTKPTGFFGTRRGRRTGEGRLSGEAESVTRVKLTFRRNGINPRSHRERISRVAQPVGRGLLMASDEHETHSAKPNCGALGQIVEGQNTDRLRVLGRRGYRE
jgi:hypothetical protein